MRVKDIKFDKNNTFFTSDTHFFHKNIIKYCDRPFGDMTEMNNKLIENWNSVVPKDGIVFHLGDVSLGGKAELLRNVLNNLNGHIYLIRGNHEHDALKVKLRFMDVLDVAEIFIEDEEITYGKQHIVMCHYPMLTWNGSHRGSWQLFGHVHGGLSNKGVIQHKPTQLDVGVDLHDFKPISYQQVKEIITKQHLK